MKVYIEVVGAELGQNAYLWTVHTVHRHAGQDIRPIPNNAMRVLTLESTCELMAIQCMMSGGVCIAVLGCTDQLTFQTGDRTLPSWTGTIISHPYCTTKLEKAFEQRTGARTFARRPFFLPRSWLRQKWRWTEYGSAL
jgi:hypothetical protein